MTKGKHSGRKTNRIVRMPATKFPKFQKKLAKGPPAIFKAPRQRPGLGGR